MAIQKKGIKKNVLMKFNNIQANKIGRAHV